MNLVSPSKTLSFLAAAVLTAVPALAQSTTRPVYQSLGGGDRTPERRQGDRFGAGGDNEPGEGGRFRRGAGRQVNDEQWEEILKFMREISPYRTAAYDEMSSPANKELIRKLVTARYDYLMHVKRDDPALYEIQVEKTRAEDSIFGILQRARTGERPVGEEERKALREEVARLVEVNLKEREMRIEKAQRTLADAKTRLEEDRKQQETLVDEKVNQYLREGARPLRLDGRDRLDRGDRDRSKPD